MFRISHSATAGVVLTAAIAFTLTTGAGVPQAQAKDPFGGKFDHYQCYQIRDWSGKPLETTVKLKDQFRSDAATTVRPVLLCNPVDKNGEGVPEPKVHMVCYSIKVENPDKATYKVKIENQLESNVYYVGGPQLLCVPSLKEIVK